jgi:hypothetical protein
MSVSRECRVLSGRGLCDELIARPEESYRLWCVVVCDLENLMNEEALANLGALAPRANKRVLFLLSLCFDCGSLPYLG